LSDAETGPGVEFCEYEIPTVAPQLGTDGATSDDTTGTSRGLRFDPALQKLCSNGAAVPDPEENPGLVNDCAALLAARDTLAGIGQLNWNADIPIYDWDGVYLGDSRIRVRILLPLGVRLAGEIPPELGLLNGLESLNLGGHKLTGRIPPELGQLDNLRSLDLEWGLFTGEIPPELGNLANLRNLNLCCNHLSGVIPPELGKLSNLERLSLWRNELTGEIPADLGQLENLEYLAISGNRLTGCIPESLRQVTISQLPFCR
jgi:hypothetical protein